MTTRGILGAMEAESIKRLTASSAAIGKTLGIDPVADVDQIAARKAGHSVPYYLVNVADFVGRVEQAIASKSANQKGRTA